MKIRLVTQQSIEEFIEQNANSLNGFRTWLTLLNSSNWEEPNDMQISIRSYASSSLHKVDWHTFRLHKTL